MSDVVISVKNLCKCYQVYSSPRDRLKQFVVPRLRCFAGRFLSSKKYFREFWALKDLSFEVRKGDVVGIIGRNGSGKSTLLQMICGTLNPSFGSIEIRGRVAALLELGSGFNPEFSGRENVYMNATILGLSREEIDQRYSAIVEFADIGSFMEQPVKTYSSGMMVRLAFSVIAHVGADILVIDEALAVGDTFFTQKCMRFLRLFMKTGTILFVSHDTGSVRSLCNKAIWLDNGMLYMQGTPKDVSERYLEAYFEEQQGGGGNSAPIRQREIEPPCEDERDERQNTIDASNLRNYIRLFCFDSVAPSFGKGLAEITSVQFLNTQGDVLKWIVGGELVVLRVNAVAHATIKSPIIGFYVKDRLGQALFGDNTYLSYMDSPVLCEDTECLSAEFIFQMPRLSLGDYSIAVALADGSQEEHVQHHWVHDAIAFRSESTSVSSGIIGIPMRKIRMEKVNK